MSSVLHAPLNRPAEHDEYSVGTDPDAGNPPTADSPVAGARGTDLPCADDATRFKTVISMS